LPRDTEAAIVVAVQTVTVLCMIPTLQKEGGTLEPPEITGQNKIVNATAVPSLPWRTSSGAGKQRSFGEALRVADLAHRKFVR